MPVRPARPEDVQAIAAIHVRSWQAAYAGLVPRSYLDSLDPVQRVPRWRAAMDELGATRGDILVVIDDRDRPAGFAHFSTSRDEDAASGSVGEIWAIYLAPEAWGKGLGRALLTVAMESLAGLGYREVTLWVLDGNSRARRFYEAAGFRPDGATKVDDRRGFPLREVRYRKRFLAGPDLVTMFE